MVKIWLVVMLQFQLIYICMYMLILFKHETEIYPVGPHTLLRTDNGVHPSLPLPLLPGPLPLIRRSVK